MAALVSGLVGNSEATGIQTRSRHTPPVNDLLQEVHAAAAEVEAEACGTCHVIGPLQASQRALLDLFPESDFNWFCQQLIGLVEEVL